MTPHALLSSVVIGAGLLAWANSAQTDTALRERANALFKPIPERVTELDGEKIVPAQVELGRMLWFDPRLSRSHLISCNSCHNLSIGGGDNVKVSIGHGWQKGPRNNPTVFNAVFNAAQFWDGRAADLKEQAAGPIANPMEMAFSHTLAVDVLESIPQYRESFKKIYNTKKITIDHVTDAIAAFEETLVTPHSRFDRWLLGDKEALTKTELEGYQLFKNIGCVACHYGPAVGGSSFQKMGIVEPYVCWTWRATSARGAPWWGTPN